MSNKLDRVYTRFLEIIDFMNRKYVSFLEEIVSLEAEILSSENRDSVSEALLLYINFVKYIIAEELGVKVDDVSTTSIFSIDSVEKTTEIVETSS